MSRSASAALLASSLALAACGKDEREHVLRGYYEPSRDRGSYLVVDEAQPCSMLLDGKPWTGQAGAPEPLPAGVHSIDCAGTSPPTSFEIKAGRTFHFNYWGP